MKLWASGIAILLLFASHSAGQTTFGSITGTVVDPTGAVVPGASVSVINESTGLERKAATSAGGVFNMPSLDVGTYRVMVSLRTVLLMETLVNVMSFTFWSTSGRATPSNLQSRSRTFVIGERE